MWLHTFTKAIFLAADIGHMEKSLEHLVAVLDIIKLTESLQYLERYQNEFPNLYRFSF